MHSNEVSAEQVSSLSTESAPSRCSLSTLSVQSTRFSRDRVNTHSMFSSGSVSAGQCFLPGLSQNTLNIFSPQVRKEHTSASVPSEHKAQTKFYALLGTNEREKERDRKGGKEGKEDTNIHTYEHKHTHTNTHTCTHTYMYKYTYLLTTGPKSPCSCISAPKAIGSVAKISALLCPKVGPSLSASDVFHSEIPLDPACRIIRPVTDVSGQTFCHDTIASSSSAESFQHAI